MHLVLDQPHPGWPSFLYTWDRPCRSWRDGEEAYPSQRMRIVTDPVAGVGAINLITDDPTAPGVWDTYTPEPIPDAPTLLLDPQGPIPFRSSAVLPLEQIRAAVWQFIREEERRPTVVAWQGAEYL
ncbi:MAG TPA: Imm1 family immunity protein [Pseudonocardiaceae bacterium]